ncbi:MAG: sporulation peptidase YabG [bacterium]|nr:sporulation peptidase YabG [bacterium]
MLEIGDLVTRNSYNNDVVFRIVNIDNNVVLLKGIDVRLVADSPLDDLVKFVSSDKENDEDIPVVNEIGTLDRNDYFYLPGRILHLDGDNEYLERCINYYNKNKVKSYGFYLEEEDMSSNILDYLKKYNPDILVITGHDAFYRKRGDNYKNTSNFVEAVREARRYEKSHEKLIIVAGACQSNYEDLIKAGANFASSPKRINIHALDPAIIAASLAFADRNDNIDLLNILERTKYGVSGMGGIITKGTMYVGFPR